MHTTYLVENVNQSFKKFVCEREYVFIMTELGVFEGSVGDFHVRKDGNTYIGKVEEVEDFPLPKVLPMDPIPAESNPFHHDSYHMGCEISGRWMAMYDKHAGLEYDDPEYIILINTRTGRRFKLVLEENKDEQETP